MLHRYTLALLAQIAQASACNRLHTLDQRCARWLLMTHDRVGRDEFPLTQDFLAQMLGVRRAGVNEAQQQLSNAGVISYVRGNVTILDRAGLEHKSCECYQLIRAEHDRLATFDPTSADI
jgi:CRP-like cAMP-binding protein